MKNVPRQPRSRLKTPIVLGGRPSFSGYYFWRLGEAVAGEPLARCGEEAAGAVVAGEPLAQREEEPAGTVDAGEPLARRGEEPAGAVDEPLVVVRGFSPPFRCDVVAAGVPQRTAGAG